MRFCKFLCCGKNSKNQIVGLNFIFNMAVSENGIIGRNFRHVLYNAGIIMKIFTSIGSGVKNIIFDHWSDAFSEEDAQIGYQIRELASIKDGF